VPASQSRCIDERMPAGMPTEKLTTSSAWTVAPSACAIAAISATIATAGMVSLLQSTVAASSPTRTVTPARSSSLSPQLDGHDQAAVMDDARFRAGRLDADGGGDDDGAGIALVELVDVLDAGEQRDDQRVPDDVGR